jgi:hypothetical protein
MVNYAAYVSARSYAVLHSQDDAMYSATMALAPVANNLNITGDIPGISAFFQELGSLLPGGQSANRYARGLINAYAGLQFGNFTVTTNSVDISSSSSGGGFANLVGGLGGGSPWQSPSSVEQVNVSINYPQFINIPGLAGLWNMLSGASSDNTVLALLNSSSMQEQLFPLAKGVAVEDIALSYLLGYGCVNIPAKCSTGYETWGDPADYQKALNNLTEFTSTFSPDDWDPNSTKWIPRQPSNSQ